jgi:hypothetical protein
MDRYEFSQQFESMKIDEMEITPDEFVGITLLLTIVSQQVTEITRGMSAADRQSFRDHGLEALKRIVFTGELKK